MALIFFLYVWWQKFGALDDWYHVLGNTLQCLTKNVSQRTSLISKDNSNALMINLNNRAVIVWYLLLQIMCYWLIWVFDLEGFSIKLVWEPFCELANILINCTCVKAADSKIILFDEFRCKSGTKLNVIVYKRSYLIFTLFQWKWLLLFSFLY